MPKIQLEDLPLQAQKDIREKHKIRKTREQRMSLNEARGYAIRMLAVAANLTPSERDRVIRLAVKLNRV